MKKFTEMKDIDLKILYEIENIKDLLNLCSTNKYLYNLCNEDFWKRKALDLGGDETVKYKNKKESWKNHFLKMVIDLEQIREAMKYEIQATLTFGREDNDMEEYSEKEIENFLNINNDKLEEAVKKMYLDYRKDLDLDDLRHAELDWYREYLYDYIPYGYFLK